MRERFHREGDVREAREGTKNHLAWRAQLLIGGWGFVTGGDWFGWTVSGTEAVGEHKELAVVGVGRVCGVVDE